MNILKQWGEISHWLMDRHGLTNVGSYPKRDGYDRVLYGIRYPDCRLLVFLSNNDLGEEPVPVTRESWDQMTTWSPPWPWSENGEMMVIPEPEQT